MKTKGLSLQEHDLIQKELKTLAEELQEMRDAMSEMNDLSAEIKAIKLFLSRSHPDFKVQFPSIMKKVAGKSQ